MGIILKKVLLTQLGLLILWITTPLSAELAESYGLGAKAVGFSGAGVASVNDWSSAFYNMAGVASPMPERSLLGNEEKSEEASEKIKLLKNDEAPADPEKAKQDALDQKLTEDLIAREEKPSHQVGMSYLYQASLMNLSPSSPASLKANENMNLAKKGASYGAVQMGLIWDLRSILHTPKNLPIKLGLAMSIRDNGTVATVNDTSVQSYNFMRLGREAQRLLLIPGVGAQVWRNRLSIGVGYNTFTGGKGKFKMQNVEIDPTGATQVPNAETQMDLTPSGAPVAGIQYRHNLKKSNRLLMAGFSWRGEMYMLMDPLHAEATTQLLAVNLPLRLSILDFYSPHTFTLGFTYFHDDSLKVSLDGEFQMWSRFMVNSARAEYMQKIGMTFDKFKNIAIFKLGVEARPGKYFEKMRSVPLVTRMGFAFIPAFTPDQTGYSNFLDNSKVAYSLGASYSIGSNSVMKAPVEITFGFQHQIWMTRTSTKSGEVLTSAEAVNQPDYIYGAHVLIFTLGSSIKF